MSRESTFLFYICDCGNKPIHGFIQKRRGGKIINEIGTCFSQESLIEMVDVWHKLKIISFNDGIDLTNDIKFSNLPTGKREFETSIERLSKYMQLSDINFYDRLVHNEDIDTTTNDLIQSIILNLSMEESIESAEIEFGCIAEKNSMAKA